ncbi:MAG: pseudouridine synthase [Varibaculum sp.]|nr:pseudouridine synthase [Varibaculum sp.]
MTVSASPQGERLQKVLARAGVASRRACEQLMLSGRVKVNGEVVRELGRRVNPNTDVLHVDDRRVFLDTPPMTVLLNKPAGVVTTMSDPQGRETVADLLADLKVRLYHVGRLDTDTEGLLVMTNDGELAHRLAHPSYEISKTYTAQVDGRVSPGVLRQLREGIVLDDGQVRADRAKLIQVHASRSLLEIELHSGRNRVVRRMLDAVGHPVHRLVRTGYADLTLKGLGVGQYRELDGAEIAELMRKVGL